MLFEWRRGGECIARCWKMRTVLPVGVPRAFLALLLCLTLLPGEGRAQVHEGQVLVEASLIPDTTAVEPGRPFTVGLRLKMAPHWHTYWRYSGDAGLPTRIEWKLPDGFTAGEIRWPAPETLLDPGDIVTYGYSDEVVLLTTITPPPKLAGGEVTIRAVAKWLVCADICVPGKADDLALTLPVGPAAPAAEEILAPFRDALPRDDLPFSAHWAQTPDAYILTVKGELAEGQWTFFPDPGAGLEIRHPALARTSSGLTVTVPVAFGIPGSIAGVLVFEEEGQRQAWAIPASDASLPKAQSPAPVAALPGLTVGKALLYGLLGGFILNLMPCVLPVIALKIFGFMKQAGQSRQRARGLGLAFVAGVFAWFLGLALVLTMIRSAGRDLNWAFQFQHPGFVLGMMVLLFVFALNLVGVFEIYLPGKINAGLAEASGREGYPGAFFHGVLATLLATPCTAPFLGPALGFAFSQSAAVVFAIFAAIAFGMSLPYILLSLEPGWIRFLPKPGGWMERVKQGMGFLLLATVIFLLWVLGRQRGVNGMALASAMLLSLGVAGWIWGTFGRAGGFRKAVAWLALLFFCLAGGFFFVRAARPAEANADAIQWQAFTPDALAEARRSGRPVFLDFTADWCVNCKTNEIFVIETAPVREAFARREVIPMQADWTNGDPDITKLLQSYGRAGVPVYVFYPPGADSAPVVLPEILTRDILLQALEKLPADASGSPARSD